ncbi:MAG TPA: 1,2-phenylacetyl-CoA epoxidase subunit PaaD [Solirubrobacterales bacterium]|nr:1,2-phenylacetyl-CoA epoxidase subunit PaaD [Solirubrobacterales bacterium]
MTAAQARAIVAEVPDPEIPVLTIEDLGILRDVAVERERVVVTVTPTYSGCPAMDVIREEIDRRLRDRGADGAEIRTVLSPAWSSDWMSEDGRRKLREYGIAPPTGGGGELLVLGVACPRCGSTNVKQISAFGATACQSQYACQACLEPFDHFKDH